MSGIGNAVVDAINDHQEVVVSGIVGIVGTGVGALGSMLVNRIRSRGKIELVECSMSASVMLPKDMGLMNAATLTEGAHIMPYQLNALLLNSFPVPKAFTIKSVGFFKGTGRTARQADRFWNQIRQTTIQGFSKVDGVMDAESFTRISIDGQWVEAGDDAKRKLEDWNAVRLSLLVAPKKIVHLWYRPDEADENGKADEGGEA